MINSRNIGDLVAPAQERAHNFLQTCEDDPFLQQQGVTILVTSTYRDNESQAALYAQGRTKPGNIVTNAKAGTSFHNYRCAFDVVPLVNGKPMWGSATQREMAIWDRIGMIGESVGLEWAKRWPGFPELAHFQYTGGLSIAELQAGAVIV